MVKGIRLKNFMAFSDTGWLELRPITLLFGRNSSGKSVIIRAIRLLKQSLDVSTSNEPIVFSSEFGIDSGSFKEVLNHSTKTQKPIITLGFACEPQPGMLSYLGVNTNQVYFCINLGFDNERNGVFLDSFSIELAEPEKIAQKNSIKTLALLFSAKKVGPYIWKYKSDFRDDIYLPSSKSIGGFDKSSWNKINFGTKHGFLPNMQAQYGILEEHIKKDVSYEVIDGKIYDVFDDEYREKEKQGIRYVKDLIGNLNLQILQFFKSISYIQPIRPLPERLYVLNKYDIEHYKKQGQKPFLNLLCISNKDVRLNILSNWLEKLCLGKKLKLYSYGIRPDINISAEIRVVDNEGIESNLSDVGFGISQVLPILSAGIFSSQNSLVVIEQPELHLHPDSQSVLADFFIDQYKNGSRFILETHSEHLLLRLQRRIAEATYQKMLSVSDSSSDKCHLEGTDVNILFVIKKNGISEVESVLVDEHGQLIEPSQAFQDFFIRDYDDVVEHEKIISILRRKHD